MWNCLQCLLIWQFISIVLYKLTEFPGPCENIYVVDFVLSCSCLIHVDWENVRTIKYLVSEVLGTSWSLPQDPYQVAPHGLLGHPGHFENHFNTLHMKWCFRCVPAKCFCLQQNVVFFPSWRRCTSVSPSACVAMVTLVSPWMLHPRWFQKVNGAELFSEVWFFSIHQHLARARWPFWCFFSSAWLSDWTPPTSYHGRCLAEWDIIAMEIEAMKHTNTNWHTHSHRLGNETGFHERAAAQSGSMKSCLSKGKTDARIELSLEGNSAQLFHPSLWKRTDLSFFFILSNVNLSVG